MLRTSWPAVIALLGGVACTGANNAADPRGTEGPSAKPGSHVAAAAAPTVLAMALNDPGGLAVATDGIFWTNSGGQALPNRGDVSRIGKDGSGQVALVEGLARPIAIVADDTALYWSDEDDGTLETSLHDGTNVKTLTHEVCCGGRFHGVDLALTSDALIFAQFGEGGIARFPKADLTAATGVSGVIPGPVSVASDGLAIYYVNPGRGTMGKSPILTDPTIDVAVPVSQGMSSPVAIAIDSGKGVFVAEAGNGRIDVIDKKGGPVGPLALGTDPVDLALDATFVYWCEKSTGRIMKVARTGGATTVLAVGQANPIAIGVDADSVYWLNRGTLAGNFKDGSLSKAPK